MIFYVYSTLQPPPASLLAESKAYTVLQSGFATFEDIGDLLDLLPNCLRAKRRRQLSGTAHPRQLQTNTEKFPSFPRSRSNATFRSRCTWAKTMSEDMTASSYHVGAGKEAVFGYSTMAAPTRWTAHQGREP